VTFTGRNLYCNKLETALGKAYTSVETCAAPRRIIVNLLSH